MRYVVLTAIVSMAWPAFPTALAAVTLKELDDLPSDQPLKPADTRVIGEWLDQCVEQLKSAKDFEAASKARQAVLDGYRMKDKANTTYYQKDYAKIASEKLQAVLALDDGTKRLQAALAIHSMPQYSIQPALDAMLRHKDPAVRDLAVSAYRAAGKDILQNSEYARKMMAALESAGMSDGSGIVVGGVLLALNPPPGVELKKEQTDRMKAVQEKIALARTKELQQGREDFVQGYRRFVNSIPEEADPKAATQILADVLEAASLAFAAPELKESTAKALTELLLVTEAHLAKLAGADKTPVQDILANEKMTTAQKGLEARLKVMEYWHKTLADRQIAPRVTAAPATTESAKPATTASKPDASATAP